jgi:predicted amidohydrolase YtcJ
MFRLVALVLASLVLVSWLVPALAQKTKAGDDAVYADMALLNGAVYTMDAARTWAQAVAIKDGKLIFVGTTGGATKYCNEATKIIDLGGKMVLPGLHDTHVHLLDGGVELNHCDLSGAQTAERVLERVARYAAAHPKEKWIRGGGWALPLFPQGNPQSSDLDKVVSDRPVYLDAQDHHSGWVNSAALKLAGITEETPDPVGGHIERKPGTKEPSGTLRESAMQLVSDLMPKLSPRDYENGLKRALALANQLGITSIQDAAVDEQLLKAYSAADKRGDLTVKVVTALRVVPSGGLGQVEKFVKQRRQFDGTRVKVRSAKIFIDGVIEDHTAALLEPYVDDPKQAGHLLFTPEEFNALVAALVKERFQVHVHAIGDRGVRVALDGFAKVKDESVGLRHHIAHLELVDQSDIARFGTLNVSPNVQAYWAQRDKYIEELTEPLVGKKRSAELYPIRALASCGAVLTAGSDWPVSSLNPFAAMEVAVTRRKEGDCKGECWLPDLRTDLKTILAAYTLGGAYVNHQDDVTGSLEVGKAADLIVIDRHLFEISTDQIHGTKVVLTILDGQVIFDSSRDKSFISDAI